MVYNIFLTTIVLSRFERIINSINAFNYLLKKYLVYLRRRSKLNILGWLNQVVQFTHKIAHLNQQLINQIYLLNAVLNKLMGSFASRKILTQSITSEKIFEKGEFFNTNHARVLKATSTTKFSVRIHFYLVYISMFSRLVM